MIDNKTNSFELANFLDTTEINDLEKLCLRVPDKKNNGEVFHAYTNGFDYNVLPPSIKQKIEDQIGKHTATQCMILKEYDPWGIHTDYRKNDVNTPTWAILIPIEFSNETHTVVFAETENISFENFKNNNSKKHYTYTEQQLGQLKHISHEDLQYVSEPISYKWEPGKLIAWKRNYLHCSDDFKKTKDSYKNALVVFFCQND